MGGVFSAQSFALPCACLCGEELEGDSQWNIGAQKNLPGRFHLSWPKPILKPHENSDAIAPSRGGLKGPESSLFLLHCLLSQSTTLLPIVPVFLPNGGRPGTPWDQDQDS